MSEKRSNNSSSIKSSSKKTKALTRGEKHTKTSWIWKHFKEGVDKDNTPVIICQEKKDDGTKCGT
ncbi:31092_t:CDS:1, partial [Racocetra persica]